MKNNAKRTYVPGFIKHEKILTSEFIESRHLDKKKLESILNQNIPSSKKIDFLKGYCNHNNISIISLLNTLEINKDCKIKIINNLKRELH